MAPRSLLLWTSTLLVACSASRTPSPANGEPRIGRTVLTRDANNPMALAVTSGGDVYYVERTGEVRLYRRATGALTNALVLEVDTAHENGLLGITLPPDFETSREVFVYYSQPLSEPLPVGAPPGRNVLARFSADDSGALDPASRLELLAVPSERLCCHEGGSLAFAPDGTLYLSVGDNTNSFASNGSAPLDRRPGRESFDAERTAQNPFDLRGKILRVARDGSIPAGNLFPISGELGRPEIFAMGVRNPFRIALDSQTGVLFWGDIGPDARADGALGPRGFDELNRAPGPGNFGWPHCIGFAEPYVERDFASGVLGAPFDCSETQSALLAYDYDSPTHDALGTGWSASGEFLGRAAMAGTVYRPAPGARYALPNGYDGALIMTDWTRDIIAAVRTDASGAFLGVERLFAGETFHRPIDVEMSADGALYVLDYGSGFWGDNADATLSRIESGAELSPIAVVGASRTSGSAPLSVEFSGLESRAPAENDAITSYAWDFDADGTPDAFGPTVTHVFEHTGTASVSLIVTASSGRTSLPVAERVVTGNSPPTVRILGPDPNSVLQPGSPVTLLGEGQDPEDGDAACDELVWTVSLGHNTHAHPATTLTGCNPTFVPELGEHGATTGSEVLFYAVELVYTDHGGANGEAALTARRGMRLDAGR